MASVGSGTGPGDVENLDRAEDTSLLAELQMARWESLGLEAAAREDRNAAPEAEDKSKGRAVVGSVGIAEVGVDVVAGLEQALGSELLIEVDETHSVTRTSVRNRAKARMR